MHAGARGRGARVLELGAVAAAKRERVARNEAAFRVVNEGIERGRDLADEERVIKFVCECGDAGCTRLIGLTVAEYEAVRTNPRRFAVLGGHDVGEAEDVVERHERYIVVEKHADTAPIVEQRDPRGAD